MNAADVIGWIVDGTYYCPSCTPSTNEGREGTNPIFGDSETDSFSHCEQCDELIPENLTDHGWKDLLETAEDFLVTRCGRIDAQRQWHEHVKDWGSDVEESTILSMWGAALRAENLKRTKKNMDRYKEE